MWTAVARLNLVTLACDSCRLRRPCCTSDGTQQRFHETYSESDVPTVDIDINQCHENCNGMYSRRTMVCQLSRPMKQDITNTTRELRQRRDLGMFSKWSECWAWKAAIAHLNSWARRSHSVRALHPALCPGGMAKQSVCQANRDAESILYYVTCQMRTCEARRHGTSSGP